VEKRVTFWTAQIPTSNNRKQVHHKIWRNKSGRAFLCAAVVKILFIAIPSLIFVFSLSGLLRNLKFQSSICKSAKLLAVLASI
jgi:hypothetical protein